MNIHLTLVPYISVAGELKTKPTQHSVQELRRIGITPDMLICRAEHPLPRDLKNKLASSCGVERNSVIESLDAPTIYQVPLNCLKENILAPISETLDLGDLKPCMDEWDILVKRVIAPRNDITIAFVGKYLGLKESYKSLTESLIHAGAHLNTRINIKWVDSEALEENGTQLLEEVDGILVPGGFGERGVEGKMIAIKYARENGVPYLGICLGMQLAMIEFARNVLGMDDANSIEFNPNCTNPIIYLIDSFLDTAGQKQIRTYQSPLGGTMRLGAYECQTKKGSLLRDIYDGKTTIKERHRHRYEANPDYRKAFEASGLIVSGESNGLIEAVELKDHPWFIGVQFHPEFTSRITNPNRVIYAFANAALTRKNG